jgi:hypothetical protein
MPQYLDSKTVLIYRPHPVSSYFCEHVLTILAKLLSTFVRNLLTVVQEEAEDSSAW